MGKLTLTEALEALQELEFMGGPGMDNRPDYTTGVRDPKNAPKNFKTMQQDDEFPYNDDFMQYGRSMGVKGRDRGSRPGEDMSGGPPTPRYQNTWEGAVDDEEDEPIPVGEGADWDEIERHNASRNKWRDTPTGKTIKKMVDGEAVDEAMGVPFQTGAVAPMDGLSVQSSGRDAKPVKDVDGDDVSAEYMPDPVDPMRGPGNMWGGPGTIPGTSRGWANSPHNQKKMRRENLTMKLREFFDPSPIAAEAIDNPDQDKHGDSTDDELEFGDMDGIESQDGDIDVDDGDEGGEGEIEISTSMGDPEEDGAEMLAAMLGGEEDKDGDDLVEPGDGNDIGQPNGNIAVMPHMGPSNFVASPDKMGAARGTFGMHSDGQMGPETVEKSSAWDVLSKVVNALDNDEEPIV